MCITVCVVQGREREGKKEGKISNLSVSVCLCDVCISEVCLSMLCVVHVSIDIND